MLTFRSVAGATTLSWVADQDYDVLATQGNVGSGVFSLDPLLTFANWSAPAIDEIVEDFQIQYSPVVIVPIMKLKKDQKIFYAPSAGGASVFQLFLEENL